MEVATLGVVGTLVGTVVGAFASILTTFISGIYSTRLQKNADSLERIERMRSFQRSNLIELQETLMDAVRLLGKAHLEFVMSFRNGVDANKIRLGEELGEKISIVNRKLTVLIERISEEELRGEVKSLRQLMTKCILSTTEEESFCLLGSINEKFDVFMGHLGDVLRSKY
jgi:hypothetical protein